MSSPGTPRISRSENFGIQHFTYGDLKRATDNFAEPNRLGFGATSTVFKCTLQACSRQVAVKRLIEDIHNRDELFMTEVQNMARLSHQNVVMLHGCTSLQSRARMIVYEYVRNGTLYDHLHGDEAIHARLPWNTRLNVAVQTANTLNYLHHHSIIHGDIETRNILLDAWCHVKLGDFGLSRLLPNGHSHVSASQLGTLGYTDPEYHRRSELTRKSDVFSFGVVMIELISSLRPYDITRPAHYLSDIAKNIIENDALDQLVDPILGFDTHPRVNDMISGVFQSNETIHG